MEFVRNANTDYMMNVLTSPKIQEMSDGRIPPMSVAQASGLIGSWIVETGDPTLTNLDVIERDAGQGRGLSQYTGSRRIPYDIAASNAMQAGVDPNSAEFQLKYFAEEYAGKYDSNGRSLVGWTRIFERAPDGLSPNDYSKYYTGSAQSGKGYFRPSVPHLDKRSQYANAVFDAYNTDATPVGNPQLTVKPIDVPEPPVYNMGSAQ